MISGLSKLKWVVLFLLLPMAGVAANSNGFVLQLKGPEIHTPSTPGSYGPIVKADTLWSVATATRPDNSLSLYKTMASILALNPHAFLNGDINKMIDGSFLKIPSAAEIRATDGSELKKLLTKKTPSKAKPSGSSKQTTSKTPVTKVSPDKLALLQNELTESNEHLLLSSETNRRLKLQLENIRMELAELKEQMAIDNQLKADLKALIEQQKATINEQQTTIEDARKEAILEAESHNNWWLIAGVSGGFTLLSLIWLGLWLKNRNDQKNNIEDGILFDSDNSVDELSDYLNTENFAAVPDSDISDSKAESKPVGKQGGEINSFVAPDLDEPNFNLPIEQDVAPAAADIVTQSATPIMPEVIERAPVMPDLNLDDNDFSDIDLTLDDESTSFENDNITPDLSWREELDEPSLIPEQPAHKANTLDEDLAEVDSMLEQFKLSNSPTGAPATDDSALDFDFNSLNDLDVKTSSEPEPAAPVDNDEFVNMDDIESILAEAELDALAQAGTDDVASDVPQTPATNDVVDMDDIESILAEAELDALAQAGAADAASDASQTSMTNDVVDMNDIDSLLAEVEAEKEISSITPAVDNNANVDMDDIDSILASAGFDEPASKAVADNVELPEAHGQTVDEMLAELDGVENTVSEITAPENIQPEVQQQQSTDDGHLDDIEAMLAEYSPNAFSAAPSEQAPIDVEAAQAEEFIDIDKLLNEVSQQPANIEDEPYDQVKLDVGLDEYSNTLLDSNAADIDDDDNRLGAQLDLARAYLEIEDNEGAKSILEPLAGVGDAGQQAEVNKLLSRL